MNAETVKRTLVDLGWDADVRRHMTDVMRYYSDHPECETDLRELDQVRAALRVDDGAMPPIDFEEMVTHLRTAAALQRPRWLRQRVSLVASAAVLLLSVGATYLATRETSSPATRAQSTLPALTVADIAGRLAAFRELDEVYDRRAGWMLLARNEADVGVATAPNRPGARVLVARLRVQRDGQEIADADLLICAGQTADVTVPGEHGTALRYRIATDVEDPRQVSLGVELCADSRGQEMLAALTTTLRAESGASHGVGSIATPGGEYQVRAAFAQAELAGG